MERRAPQRTTASRIKCLYLAVIDARGTAAASRFLESAGVQEDLISDETRPVPGELWYRSLSLFEEWLGPKALDDSAPFFLHPDNVAVWTAVLRGAEAPAEAFRQLDRLGLDRDDEEEDISDWTTLRADRASWLGAAPLPPRPEDVDRVTRARLAELRALTTLFGCKVRRLSFTHVPEEGLTRFALEWSRPWHGLVRACSAVGAAAGGLAAWSNIASWSGLLWLSTGSLAGLAVGAAGRHDAVRRARAHSQTFRIQALERSGSLRGRRDAAGSLFGSGAIVGGTFRLRRAIGLGAAGSVWEAERLVDNKPVALKLLRTAVAHDSQAADRLRREADALGLAWHPNVVEVLDHGHLASGLSYLVMELLAGESLAQRLERDEPLETEELYEITLQACDALDAVHAAGVVHRDIKPSNLFLTRDSEGKLRLKLVDFGVAQVAWAETRLTRSGTALGTPGYMAPEQETGRVVDGRSDLFSLGGVLYEALTGRPPPIAPASFEPGLPVQWIDLEGVPTPWRAVLARLLAPRPNQRFSDARELRDALRAMQRATRQATPIERITA